MITRYVSGNTTLTLTGDLAAWADGVVKRVGGELVKEMQKLGEEVAADARLHWYDEVNRETGMSSDWRAVTEIDGDNVIVGVKSFDPRVVKKGAVAAFFVRRRGPLAVIKKEITEEKYWPLWRKQKESGGQSGPDGFVFKAASNRPNESVVAGKYYQVVSDPKASDGKQQLQELVRKPFKARVKALMPKFQTLVVTSARRK